MIKQPYGGGRTIASYPFPKKSLASLFNSRLKYCHTNDCLTAELQLLLLRGKLTIYLRAGFSLLKPMEPSFRLCRSVFPKCSDVTGAVHTSLRRALTHIKPLKTAKAILLPGPRVLSILCCHRIGERWRLSAPLGKSRAEKANIFIVPPPVSPYA